MNNKAGKAINGKDVPGIVEELGFLEGNKGFPALGWLNPKVVNRHKVQLLLNGQVIAETYAGRNTLSGNNDKDFPEFAFRCDELVDYLGAGDTLKFTCEEKTLLVKDRGEQIIVDNNRESRASEVCDKLEKGYVFDNLGRFRKARDEKGMEKTFRLFRDLEQFMKERYSYDLIVCFGALLGAVREKGFISHDTKGLDAIYISKYSNPEEVVAEFKQICFDLIDAGYMLRINRESAYVNSFESDSWFVDLNYGWFTENDELNMAFGWYEEPARGRDRYFSFRETTMAGEKIKIPGNAEEILFQCYGPNWHIPDQGFTHDSSRRIVKKEYLLSYEEVVKMLHLHLRQVYEALQYEKENSGVKGSLKKMTPLSIKRFFRRHIDKLMNRGYCL